MEFLFFCIVWNDLYQRWSEMIILFGSIVYFNNLFEVHLLLVQYLIGCSYMDKNDHKHFVIELATFTVMNKVKGFMTLH